jgi:phosphate transport system protein
MSMERHFEKELEELKRRLVEMGALVDRQLDDACEALFSGRGDLARAVIDRDVEVDAMDNDIDKHCQKILALSQPVAVDLRLLIAALQINTQLERVGDIAVNLAERTEVLAGSATFLRTSRLQEMIQIARIMVHDSLESFVTGSAALAGRVIASDDVVDNLGRETFHAIVRSMREDTSLIEPGSVMLILIHHVERMADHATNIAEGVIFLVEAKLVKHNPAATEPR